MFGIMPLSPAYGRDYKSKAAVLEDWHNGKDFKTCSGQYCSRRDFIGKEVTIRYSSMRKVLIIPA
jgi:hypothetical protein